MRKFNPQRLSFEGILRKLQDAPEGISIRTRAGDGKPCVYKDSLVNREHINDIYLDSTLPSEKTRAALTELLGEPSHYEPTKLSFMRLRYDFMRRGEVPEKTFVYAHKQPSHSG